MIMTDIFPSNNEIIQHVNRRIWYRTITPITFWYCCATNPLQEKWIWNLRCTTGGAECTDKMLLLNSWKFIWSEIWKFICFSLMAFSFWRLVLFGVNEHNEGFSISFSSKMLTTSSIPALFYCSFFYHFLSLSLILGHHSKPTHLQMHHILIA